ncbi:MAG: hypothetical protein NTY80_04925 [candidate division SR1 bacterium]|nr:hypothetical protein [candidate division SR1 bacterium]
MEPVGENKYISPSKSKISSAKINECILIFIKKSTLYREARETAFKDIEEHRDDYEHRHRVDKNRLASRLPESLEKGDFYFYRGIAISLETLKKIIFKEGLKINKTEDEKTYFTSTEYYNKAVIGHAGEGGENLSIIFQIPASLFKRYGIDVYGVGDNVHVDQDIPAKLIRETNIFLINYESGTLTEIKGNPQQGT